MIFRSARTRTDYTLAFMTPQARLMASLLLAFLGMSSAPPSAAQTAASAYTTGYRYSVGHLLTGVISPDPDGPAGPLPFPATRNTYAPSGLLTRVEKGALAAWQPTTTAPSSWAGFTIYEETDYSYDSMGRKLSETLSANGVTYQLIQYSYDAYGRLSCTATRMNAAAFASAPASACVLGTAGSDGPDRVTQNAYDSYDRVTSITRALGANVQEQYAIYTYTPNGKQQTIQDAKANLSTYNYDEYDRLAYFYLPSPTTTGTANPADYEAYTYDNNGNRTSVRKRDGSVVSTTYDALNRPLWIHYPAASTPDVGFSYDLRGLQLSAMFASSTGTLLSTGVATSYDGFGNVSSSLSNQSGTSWQLQYTYDAEGHRTSIKYPDNAAFSYVYDGLNRLQTISEGATVVLAAAYSSTGVRTSLTRGASIASSTYVYDDVFRIKSISHDLDGAGTLNDDTEGLGYNAASQITTLSHTNGEYAFTLAPGRGTAYQANGLNQYSQVGAVTPTYDARGNLVFDGATTYGYDLENRLLTASGAYTAAIAYDPKGRLFEVANASGAKTRFLYDGDNVVAEYDGFGTLLRRYVNSGNVDDHLLWYEGASVGSASRRYLYTDHLHSTIAVTDSTGMTVETDAYDAYGVAAANNRVRFQFTGQMAIPEVGLYYYRARYYSPQLGRFLQTDPVGYKDDVNLYTYVSNDPLDRTDPSGTESPCITNSVACVDSSKMTSEAFLGVLDVTATIVAAIDLIAGSHGVVAVLEAALEQGAKTEIKQVIKEKAATEVAKNGETLATRAGRQAHKDWDPGNGFEKEVSLSSGKRADAVNFEAKHVKELKPDNPRAIKRGEVQVETYRRELQAEHGGTWTSSVETY